MPPTVTASFTTLLAATIVTTAMAVADVAAAAASPVDHPVDSRHLSIGELTPAARIHLGKTADWVAISDGAVWVATTGPFSVVEIDPRTDTIAARVALPGNPCSGLAVGFGGLWIPLCTKPASLARVDLRTHDLTWVAGAGPAAREGGITVSTDAVWLVVDRTTLAKIDPARMIVSRRIAVPAGSLNPVFAHDRIWVTRSTGASVVAIDARTGAVLGSIPTGPRPRFLAGDERSVWTLDQGDGTLTRIDAGTRRTVGSTALETPGPGGDVKLGHGLVWTTMIKVPLSITDASTGHVLCQWRGAGGDSLEVGRDALWLTDYTAGDVYHYGLDEIARRCETAAAALSL